MKKLTWGLFLVLSLAIYYSCENETEVAATIKFKTAAGYASHDSTVAAGSELTVGIIATKAENNLKSYNVSVSFDNAATTKTVQNFIIPAIENSLYDKDVTFTIRNQKGEEKYYFTIVDTDGNIIQKNLTFTIL